ncbi:MAG TPA: hypothetical protein VGF06_12305 [Terriglobales bacterium]|jgi:hypothetical protein
MITTAIIVICSLLCLLYMIRLARGHAVAVSTSQDLRNHLRPLDLQAFRNLVNPAEDAYLRTSLSGASYRKVRRYRLRAALSYVSCAAGNAALLVQLGEAARRSTDPAVVEAGENLVNSAIRLRVYSFQAALVLRLNLAFPSRIFNSARLAERYETLSRQGVLLGHLQFHGRGISAAL